MIHYGSFLRFIITSFIMYLLFVFVRWIARSLTKKCEILVHKPNGKYKTQKYFKLQKC